MTHHTSKLQRRGQQHRRFTLRRMSLAMLVLGGGLWTGGAAWALPQGATVVSGLVTVLTPTATQQVITQGSDKAIIDWTRFSIGAGERVRFVQPSSTAVVLNRVTGYDPSAILGRMDANGSVFLLNPYGVVFGAGARIDVGGLVASSLSMANADFNAGRYSLSLNDSSAPGQRGEVRNEGRISAPGGTVALVGPQVSNTGRIDAAGGRVGLAAASAVLVDVEGDGLVFFQARAGEAQTRLEQLGRIRADGGSVELRAAARGQFADTVLNLGGVVQARGLGTRDGRIVIDGGNSGITQVSGRLDVSGRADGQTGGRIDVSGERVLLDNHARLDAAGAAGGGTVRIGGGFQGHDADIRNATATRVAAGAQIHADALHQGDGGLVVVWADGHTRFAGGISARGGAAGGDGGRVETSGKATLAVSGTVDTRAAKGTRGNWLLDPTNIDVVAAGGDTALVDANNFNDPDTDTVANKSKVNAALINGSSTNVELQATNDVSFETGVTLTNNVNLTVRAGHSIDVKNAVTASGTGSLLFSANDQTTGSTANGTGSVSISATVTGGATGTIGVTNNGSSDANVITAALTGAQGVTVTGATTLGTGSSVSAGSGGVTFAGAVTLADDSVLTGASVSLASLVGSTFDLRTRSNVLTITGTATGTGNLTIEPSATATTIGLAGGAGTLQLSAALLAKFGTFSSLTIGRTDGTGLISANALTLPTATTLEGNTAAVTLGGVVTGAAKALDIATTGTATFSAALNNLGSLNVDGNAALNGSTVTTTGAQNYNGSVTLGAATTTTTLTGTSINLDGATTALDANGKNIRLNTRDLSFGAGSISNTGGTAALGGFAAADTVDVAVTAPTATAVFTQAEVTKLGGFTSLTIGRSDGTGAITSGALTLAANTAFLGNSATVDLGAITGASNSLSSATTGLTTLGGAVAGISTLGVTGPTRVEANVTSTGTQTYSGSLTLGANSTLTTGAAGAIAMGSLVAGTFDLNTRSDALTLTGTATGTGDLSLAPAADATSIGLAGGAGTLQLSSALLAKLGSFNSLSIGRSGGTGTITAGALTLPTDTTLLGNASAVVLASVAGGGNSLSVATGGSTTVSGAVSGLSTLDMADAVSFSGGSVASSGAQTYAGLVTLGADTTFTGSALAFDKSGTALAAGANDLALRTGAVTRGNNGNITSSGAGSVTLAGFTAADTVEVGTAAAGADANFDQTLLSDLTDFSAITIGRSDGTGAITANALTLPLAMSFVGSSASVDFTGAITGGGHALSTSTTGLTTFGATVTALTTLGVGGATQIDTTAITTTGSQTYTGALTLGSNTTLAASGVTAGISMGSLAGSTFNLRTRSSALAITGAAGGTGTLTIEPFANGTTVGLAGGAGTLQLSAALLAKFGSFSNLTIGRALSTVDINANALTLPTDTTLVGASSDIFLASVAGGGNSLTITAGGTTTATGTMTGLTSLGISGPSTLSGGAVTTSGAQTYGGLVTLGAATTFTGTTLAFDKSGNALAAGANNLVLRTRDLTRANGGALNGTGTITLAGFAAGDTVEVGTGAAGATANFDQALLDDVAGFASLTLGRSDGSGAITVNDLTLNKATTFAGGSATLDFTGAITGGSHALASTITSGLTTLTSTASATGLTSLSITGPSRIDIAAVNTSGTQTYTGAVTLGVDTTLTGSGVAFGSTVNGAQSLTVNASGVTAFNGAVGGSTALTALSTDTAGSTTLAGNVTSSGAIVFDDAVTVNAASTLTGTTIDLNNATTALAAGGNAIGFRTGALTFGAGSVTGTGVASLATFAAGDTLDVATGAGQNYGQATLNKFAGFSGLTLGRSDGSGAVTVGAITLPTATTVLAGSATVDFTGAITGAGKALTSTSSGLTTLGGAATNLASLSINGSGGTALNVASVATTGTQTYGGTLTLSADSSLTASGISIGTLAGGSFDLDTRSNALAISGTANGSGNLSFAPSTAGATIGLAGGTGALQLSSALLAKLGSFGSLSVGRSDGTGTITAGALTLPTATTITGDSANVALTGIVTGAGQSLAITSGGTTTVSAALNNLASLGVAGDAALNGGAVTTSGAQTYGGAVTLGANTTLAGTDVAFVSTVDGARSLTVNASGNTGFGGAVGGGTLLTSLSTDAAGTTTLGGNVSTSAAQTYNDAVTLAATSIVTGSAVRFNGTVDATAAGAQGLTVNASGATVFGAAVGATQALASLATDAGGTVSLRDVSTQGAIALGEAATLNGTYSTGNGDFSVGGNTTLAGTLTTISAGSGDVTFTGSVGASAAATQSLAVDSSGATRFGAAVGNAFLPLTSLTTDAGGSTRLGGGVFTSGDQTYGDNVLLTADTTLDATSLTFGAGLNVQAFDLTLQYDLTLTGPASPAQGTGFVSLAPRNAASSIDVAGSGVGTFEISQAALNSLTSLPNLGVGRNDGTGTITVGALSLPSNFRLQSGSGDITFTDTVTGAGNALTVATTGTTRLAGTMSGLTSLTVGSAVTLAADTTIGATTVTFNGTVDAATAGGQALTVNASGITTFADAVGGTTALASLTTDAAGSTRLAGNVRTDGAQAYGDAVLLTGSGALSLDAGSVAFGGTLDGARTLTVNASGNTAFGAAVGGGIALTSLSTDAAGSTSLGGDVRTSAAQTYNDAVTLNGDATLTATTVAFAGTVDGAQALTLNASGATTFGASVGGGTALVSLTTDAPGSTTLGASLALNAASLNIGDDLALAAFDISIRTNALTLGGTVAGSGDLAIGTATAGASMGLAGGAGTLQLSSALLAKLTPFASLTLGRTGGSGTITAGTSNSALTLPTDTTVIGNTADLDINGDVAGAGHTLAITTGGTTTLAADLAGLGSLSVTGTLALGADSTVAAGSVALNNLAAAGFDLSLNTDAWTLAGTASGSGTLAVAPTAAGTTIGLAGGAGSLQIDSALLAKLGSFGTLSLGRSDGTGTITAAALVLPTNTRLVADNASVNLDDSVTGAGHALSVSTSGDTTLGGTVAGLSRLTLTGPATLAGGSIASSGAQSYGAAVTLGTDTTLSASAVTFSADVDGSSNGAQALTVEASGITRFAGAVGATTSLASLTTDAGGSTRLAGNVRTDGAQAYGDAVTLTGTGALLLDAGSVAFASTLDGARSLVVNSAGSTRFGAAVGGTTALTSLTTDAAGGTRLGGNVRTSGAQTYNDAVTLAGDATLGATAVAFGSTLDGAHALTVNASGATSFAASVGTTNALTSLSTDASGTTSLLADLSIDAGALRIRDNLASGAFDVTLRTNALTLGGSVAGSGDLAIGTATAASSMGLAGGAGTLQLSSTLLAKLTPFASLTLGRADGTGTITAGTASTALSLPTDTTVIGNTAAFNINGDLAGAGHALDIGTGGRTTLAATLSGLDSLDIANATRLNGARVTTSGAQTYGGAVVLVGRGDLTADTIAFDGTVDGAHALQLAGTGGTRFAAAVGGSTPLASLVVDGPLALDGGSVATTGAQTYNGALTLGSDNTLSGSTLRFNAELDGAQALLLDASAGARFAAAVGSGTALTSLRVDGATRIDGGVVRTVGTQRYNGSLTLGANTDFDGSGLRFDTTVNGAFALNSKVSGNTSFGGEVGGSTALASLTVANTTTLAAPITTSGSQRYGGNVTVNADTALQAASIDFGGTVNGAGGLSASTTGTLTFNGAVGDSSALANLSTRSGGVTQLGTSVSTGGAQSYSGKVVLGADTTLNASAVSFNGALDGAHALQVNASGITRFGGEVGGTTALASLTTDAPGATQIGANVSTSGAQTYNDPVLLVGDSTLTASNLTFASAFNASTFAIDLQAGTVVFGGPVSGTGSIVLAPSTAGAAIGVATGGNSGFQVTQAAIDQFGGFSTVVIGRKDGTGDITVGALTLPTGIRVRSGSGDVDFTGTVNSVGGVHDLSVSTTGLTRFGAAVGATGALQSLSVDHDVALNGATVTTVGSQSYGGDTTLGAATTLRASAIEFGGDLSAAAFDLRAFTDQLALVGQASGSGRVSIATRQAGGSIGLAGAAGDLQLSQALIDHLSGMAALTVGRSDGTGAIAANALTLPLDLRVQSASGDVGFAGTLDSAAGTTHALAVATQGGTRFDAAVGALDKLTSLSVTDGTRLGGGSVSTTGAQSYGGAVLLGADTTLAGSSVTLAGTTDGAQALTVNAGTTRFGAAVGGGTALKSLTTNAAGSTTLTGDVHTTGAQTYDDDLRLAADAALSGSALAFNGTLDGSHALGVDGGSVAFRGEVGGGTALDSLAVKGNTVLDAAGVRTTGNQAYGGTLTLASDTRLDTAGLRVDGAVDGAHALAVQTSGSSSFGAAIGGKAALTSLRIDGGGQVRLAGASVDTRGAQTYSGAVQLNGDSRFTGSSLRFGGAVAGAGDLQLQTDALSVASTLGGSGELSIAPVTRGVGIGLAGGAGALQVTQALLDGATGFTQHTFGRSDGTGNLSAGALRLRADTTLQTGSGDLNLNGSVDGAFDLALHSAGNTHLAGPVGANTALRSLATDAAGSSTLDGDVFTTGTQTYADPLQTHGPLRLSGSTITAEQASNHLDGALSVRADSLQLRSASAVTLADVSLANGGSVETDGVLTLSGALALNGGTLSLVSNATPRAGDFSDDELKGRTLSFGLTPVKQASATIVQTAGATLASSAGSLLVVRSPGSGSILLDQAGNTLLGDISVVSGPLGDNSSTRFGGAGDIVLGFVRIASSEIHASGAPPASGAADPGRAGIEGDVLWLSADAVTTGPTGQLRARLPFDNSQGSKTSVAGLTLTMGSKALDLGGGFGTSSPDGWIQVRVGSELGGYITLRPKGVSGDNAFVLLGGAEPKPFYDGAGKATEIRVFYNGDAPRTPQESGALQAVTAVVEEARHARFEEAVRTENVSSRLRSGVIAEVGAGRPATVGRESIRLPQSCNVKPNSLACE